MTADQFSALAALCRMRTSSRTYAACKAALVDGVPVATAARTFGLARQTVAAQVKRVDKALRLSRQAVLTET